MSSTLGPGPARGLFKPAQTNLRYQSHCEVERIYNIINMCRKMFIVLCLAAVALAVEYPAGVHPAVCPNYPYCDPSALARHTPDGIPIPQWGLNPALYAAASAPVPAAPKYPAGLPPALCPNYPYCW